MATEFHHLIDPQILKNRSYNNSSKSFRSSRSPKYSNSTKSSTSSRNSKSCRRSRSRSFRRSRSRSSRRELPRVPKRTCTEELKSDKFIKQENKSISFYNANELSKNYFDDKENISNSIVDGACLIKNAHKKHKNMQSTIIRSPSPKTRVERYTKDNADDCSWSSESPELTKAAMPADESFEEISGHLIKY